MRTTFNHLLSRIPRARILGVLLLSCACLGAVNAQTIFGRISGTITDPAGAVLPNVPVTVTNEATNLTRTVTTDEDGFYVVTNLPVGNYTLLVEQSGFKKSLQSGNSLVADGRLTINLALETGEVTETVEVTSAIGETVNTTSGEVARVIDGQQVRDLALNGRNYMQLSTLIPGAALLDDDQLGLSTSLSVTGQAINGNRGNTNNLTVDGGFNLDSGSNGSQINNVGIDFIQEVKIQTSNFSAEYGRNSGAAINVVTRSGGNEFHGSAFEFFRNDKLDARTFFAPVRPILRYNNFGYSFGGPIIKDKFFFFGGQEWKYIRRFTEPQRRTLPTRAERRGDFSGRTATLNVPTGYTAINPATGATVAAGQPIPGRNLANLRLSGAPVGITPNGRAIAAVYDFGESAASSYVDTPTGNNAVFQESNPFDFRQDILRLDYRFNQRHIIYGRYLKDKYDLIEPFGTFINSQIPTIPTNRLRPGTGIQLSYTWLITPKLINEAKINGAWNGQRIPPFGEAWERDTYGFTFPQLFSGGRFDNGIPNVDVAGFANFRGPSASLLSPTTDIAFSDNLTIIRGSHSLRTGILIARNRKDQNGRPIYTGSLNFSTGGNTRTTGNAFADALLGNFRTYNEADDDPIGFFRFTQIEGYVTDSWKVNRKLNLELGARYYYMQPTYTQANNIVNFDPSLYDPAQAVRVNPNGTLVANSGNRFNGLIRAGDGVPADEIGRVPTGDDPQVLAVPAGAPRGLFQTQHKIAPRVSFAYAPFEDNKTSFRGGFGMFFDRPEGNIIFSSVNIPPFISVVQFENGNLSAPSSGAPSALAAFGQIDTVDPNLDIPYTMSFSLSVQRELPRGFFLETAYVGNLGRHLLRQPDINQASFDDLRANAALPAANRASVNFLRPYKGYSQIRMRLSDSTSNYNALQVYLAKRTGQLRLTGSYTFSKALADSSGNGDNPEDPTNRRYSYGPTSFDRRHIFVGTYTYSFGSFDRLGFIGDVLLSDWEVSGVTRFQSGQYYTPTADSSIGGRRADYLGGPTRLANGERTPNRYVNAAAFSPAPEGRRGSAGVGIIEGPGRQDWDISVRRIFPINERFRVRFQTDFFNAFNRANFGRSGNLNVAFGSLNPVTGGPTNLDFGTISSAGPGRNIQFALKLEF